MGPWCDMWSIGCIIVYSIMGHTNISLKPMAKVRVLKNNNIEYLVKNQSSRGGLTLLMVLWLSTFSSLFAPFPSIVQVMFIDSLIRNYPEVLQHCIFTTHYMFSFSKQSMLAGNSNHFYHSAKSIQSQDSFICLWLQRRVSILIFTRESLLRNCIMNVLDCDSWF